MSVRAVSLETVDQDHWGDLENFSWELKGWVDIEEVKECMCVWGGGRGATFFLKRWMAETAIVAVKSMI